MNRTSLFFRNMITAGLLHIVMMLAGLIVPRFILKYYGSETNGLVTSINQFVNYFKLAEAGVSAAAVYALYRPLADNNKERINGIIAAAKDFYSQAGYAIIALVFGMSIIYPYFVQSASIPPHTMRQLVVILGANAALEFFTLSKYRVLLTADQRVYIISLATMINYLVSTAAVVILSIFRVHIVLVQIAFILPIFIRSIILRTYVSKHYSYVDFSATPDKNSISQRWDAFYLQALGATQHAAPVALATVFTNLKWVSVYTIFNMVGSALNSLLGVFINGLYTSFGDVIAKEDKSVLQKVYTEFEFAYYSLIAVAYSVAMVMIMPFIRIYTSGIMDISYDIPIIGFLVVLNGILYNIKTPQGMLIHSAGLFKETKIQSTIQAAILVVFGIILAPSLGLVGILIAACLSNLYRDVDLLFYVPKHITGLPVSETAYRVIRMLLQIAAVWGMFSILNLKATSISQWFLWAIIVAIASCFVVVLSALIFDRVVLKSIIRRMRNIMKGKSQ